MEEWHQHWINTHHFPLQTLHWLDCSRKSWVARQPCWCLSIVLCDRSCQFSMINEISAEIHLKHSAARYQQHTSLSQGLWCSVFTRCLASIYHVHDPLWLWWAACTPLWKSNGTIFLDPKKSIDCVWYLLKDPLAKFNSAKYLSTVISRSWVVTYWKEHDVNIVISNWVELFDYKTTFFIVIYNMISVHNRQKVANLLLA